MASPSPNPSDPFEDLLARKRWLAGEKGSGEFATDVANVVPAYREPEEDVRREFRGPLYPRGEWSPLRRAWLCLQVALAAGAAAVFFYVNDFTYGLVSPFAALAVSSLSLGLLLLARSSAVYEIRTLNRERRRLRDQADAFALYTEHMTKCLTSLAIDNADPGYPGAPVVRNLLERGRRALASAGHEGIALLVLRREADRFLLTYSCVPEDFDLALAPTGYPIDDSILQACRDSSAATHSVQFVLCDRRQELLALSSRPFRRCDRLALQQLAACLSLVAAPSLARR